MQKVFECHYTFYYFAGVFIIFIIILWEIMMQKSGCISKQKKTEGFKRKILHYPIIVFVMFEILLFLLNVDDFLTIYLPYKKGQYKVVEGFVSDYYTSNLNENFQINDVYFSYRTDDAILGYHRNRKQGGYILGNQQHVKVEYIEHKRLGNVIVGLWVEKNEKLGVK